MQLIIKDEVIKQDQFSNRQDIEEIIFTDVIRVEPNAFKDCRSLSRITFNSDNTKNIVIESGAFTNCDNLKIIDLLSLNKNTVIYFSNDAFRNTHQRIFFRKPMFGFEYLDEYIKKHNYC